jgi:hypothetical protein
VTVVDDRSHYATRRRQARVPPVADADQLASKHVAAGRQRIEDVKRAPERLQRQSAERPRVGATVRRGGFPRSL